MKAQVQIQPNATEETTEETPRTRGWQQRATIPVHMAMYTELQAAIPPASQAWLQSNILPTSSGSSSSSVISVCTSRSLHVLVGAVALSTPLATTAQHVLSQESYEPKEAPLKGQQHASAEKGGPESPQTPGSQTSTYRTCPGSTTVA